MGVRCFLRLIPTENLSHANIIKYCSRPWKTAQEMNEAMIKAWNEKIAPGDDVYHLGDIAFIRDMNVYKQVVERLNGNIHIIFGNHDHLPFMKECSNIKSICRGYMDLDVENQSIALCHFPFEEWNKMHHGSWHFHGHVHNSDKSNYHTITKIKGRVDVGVDNHPEYVPFSFEELQEIIKNEGN